MSMFSESATAGTIQAMVTYLKKQLDATDNPEVAKALRAAGRHALTLFEWDTPEWAKSFERDFAEFEVSGNRFQGMLIGPLMDIVERVNDTTVREFTNEELIYLTFGPQFPFSKPIVIILIREMGRRRIIKFTKV